METVREAPARTPAARIQPAIDSGRTMLRKKGPSSERC